MSKRRREIFALPVRHFPSALAPGLCYPVCALHSVENTGFFESAYAHRWGSRKKWFWRFLKN